MELPASALREIVARALDEDLGRGDLTTDACVSASDHGRATLTTREALVLAGMDVFAEVYRQVDATVRINAAHKDGQRLAPDTVVATVEGPAASLLKGERVALNFVQRMCGVATLAHSYVDALPKGTTTRITDTRKTTPGLRLLERYAVRCGGAHNHRNDLSSAVLIKDNHIAACGSIVEAIRRCRASAPHTAKITCEVDTMEQLELALSAGADIVMLDNFDDNTLADAVKLIAGRALTEVSGGVTRERIPIIAAAGVDIISVGALTHSAPARDLGLDWI
jgi:nicotinate-nucleotide pyrophosphorylase (carboxylating)